MGGEHRSNDIIIGTLVSWTKTKHRRPEWWSYIHPIGSVLSSIVHGSWTSACEIPRLRIKSFLKSRRQQMPTLLLRSMTCSRALITPPVCSHRGHFRFNGVCCKGHVGNPLWRLYHSLEAEIFRRIVHLVLYLKYWSLPRVHMGLGSHRTRNWGRLRPQILIF